MKIVYNIAGTCHSGGMERVLANKANSLAARGYEVVIVTTDQHGEAPFFALDSRIRCIDLGINYEENNGHSFFDKLIHYPGKLRRHKRLLTQVLMEEKPDVCISMFCNDVSFITDIADGSKKVLEIHFSKFKRLQYGRKGIWRLVDELRSRHDERLVRRFDRFVVLTEEDSTYWGPLLNMTVIPNARSFVPTTIAALDAPKAVAVGRLTYQKGFERLVEAWRTVHAVHPDWTLDIVGEGEDRERLQTLIDSSGLHDVVVLRPATDDVEHYYVEASMVLSTSRYEGLPMTLLEAQACGLPAVCFACQCGPRDVIKDGENGLLVPEGDVAAMAERITRLIEDSSQRKHMGQAARAMSESYSEEKIMPRWESLFQDLVNPGNRRTLVISAVNLRKGGTLTILRQCLCYLSERATQENLRVVALVHKKELCRYPGIEYIEIPWSVKSWFHRLWCEYVTMNRISKQLEQLYGPICLWLSLHDTTPRVRADRQAVYCQTSFPFLHGKWTDLRFDKKIILFRFFSLLAYSLHVKRNRWLVVQANWLRDGLAQKLRLPVERFIVAPPVAYPLTACTNGRTAKDHARPYTFLYVATPDCHKNFETLCEAARLLEKEASSPVFRVAVSIDGSENRYAAWIKKCWGTVKSIDFCGFLSAECLRKHYAEDDCLVFPSRVETWGLPITEFGVTGKPMLLADLPYAHETAAGQPYVSFFPAEDAHSLAYQMKRLLTGDDSALKSVPEQEQKPCWAKDWEELFDILLDEHKDL